MKKPHVLTFLCTKTLNSPHKQLHFYTCSLCIRLCLKQQTVSNQQCCYRHHSHDLKLTQIAVHSFPSRLAIAVVTTGKVAAAAGMHARTRMALVRIYKEDKLFISFHYLTAKTERFWHLASFRNIRFFSKKLHIFCESLTSKRKFMDRYHSTAVSCNLWRNASRDVVLTTHKRNSEVVAATVHHVHFGSEPILTLLEGHRTKVVKCFTACFFTGGHLLL